LGGRLRGRALELEEELNGRSYTTIKFPIVQGDRKLLAGFRLTLPSTDAPRPSGLLLEQQLQQSQRLESLGVLAGGIAHDFNQTFLSSVLGNTELALQVFRPTSPPGENLLEIAQASHRAAALCRQMLAYSGRGKFVTEAIDLSALIEDMLDLAEKHHLKKTTLGLHLQEALPLFEGDPSQLSQVIMNLVINASEALGDADGMISISTEGQRVRAGKSLRQSYPNPDLPTGRYVILEVSDNRLWHGHRGEGAPLRAVLHHQVCRPRFGGSPRSLESVAWA